MEVFRIPNEGINVIVEAIEICLRHTRIVAREKAFRNSESSSFLIYTHERIMLAALLCCIRVKSNIVNRFQGKEIQLKGGKEEKMAYGIFHVIVVCIINNASGA